MSDAFTRDQVKKALLATLREREVPVAKKEGPRTLFLYNEGLERLDAALAQAAEITARSAKSYFYQGPKAASLMTHRDVKAQTRATASLNGANNETLARVLDHTDVLLLPTFSLRVAARVAQLGSECFDAHLIQTALCKGVKVVAACDGFVKLGVRLAGGLAAEVEELRQTLTGFGLLFVPTESLLEAFLGAGGDKSGAEAATAPSQPLPIVSKQEVETAIGLKHREVNVTNTGLITPLARELAKEYGIEIVRENRS